MVERSSTKKRPRDINALAAAIVAESRGEAATDEDERKGPAASSPGRREGLKGGKARAAKLTPEQRREIAKKATEIRRAAKNR